MFKAIREKLAASKRPSSQRSKEQTDYPASAATDDYVWVSAIFKSAVLNRGWDVDLFHEGRTEDGALYFKNKNGEPIPEELRPHKIWANADDPPIKKLPPVFDIGYATLVSEDACRVFSPFDLGKGSICPMREGIFQSDQSTRYATNYSSWVIGNKKNAVLLDQSEGKRKLNRRGDVWHLKHDDGLADDMVAVSGAALEGPDQWVDPLLQGSLFLSRQLGDAIVEAGLKKAFFLHRARVI